MEENAASNPAKPLPRSQPTQKRLQTGSPTGENCCWTPELDEVLRTAWSCGGLRAAQHAIRQEQPMWSNYSIKRRAAVLGLRRSKPQPWTETEINGLLFSIDSSNASLSLIAKRLGRSLPAVRRKLWALGYRAESLGGYKVKQVADMLSVPPRRVEFWVRERHLLTKGGRITESSFSSFLRNHPEKVPYDRLPPEMQSWLHEMGYPAGDEESSLATVQP